MKKSKEETLDVEILDLDVLEKEIEPKDGFFTKIKNGWDSLSKKQKVLIIVVSVLVILLVAGVIIYLNIDKKEEKKVIKKKQVVLKEDNYRYEDGTLYFVVNDKDVGSYECKNKDKNLCYVAYLNNDDDFDQTKYENVNGEETKIRSEIINKRYAFVYDNKEEEKNDIYLYDIKKEKDIGTYKLVKTYNIAKENIVFLLDEDNKYGMLDLSSDVKEIIPFNYDYLGIITENTNTNVIVASENNGYYLVDFEGKKVSKVLNGAIKNYNSNYIKTKDATNKYILYDYNGTKIIDNLLYIDLLDEYYLAVNEENKLNVFGYDNMKYTEDGVQLYNNDYVKLVSKNELNEESRFAYNYNLQDKMLTINVNNNGKEESTTINLMEGLKNQSLKYINYFNRVLYFYSDEAKTTLINSYRCNNANTITKEDSPLDKCFLASDTNEADNETSEVLQSASIVPVFNNRFVFIKDGDYINLVDLVSEKVIGAYLTINTYSDISLTEPYIKNTSELYIIAKNKNKKYGLLKLTDSSITSIYNFEYDRLEKLKDYILAKKDNQYYLLDYHGNRVTKEFNAPIRNYNDKYLKILNKNKYYVYDFSGNLIFEDGYKYVELYDKMVGLVDDANHLSVVDYDSNMLISEILKLSSTTYFNAKEGYVPAFTMKVKDNILTITAATSQDTKKENSRDFVYDLTTKRRVK